MPKNVLANILAITLLALLAVIPAQARPSPPPVASASRTDTLLDGPWKFHRGAAPHAEEPKFDDAAWDAVTLPHTWNARDGEDGGKRYYRGVGWYRIHCAPPASPAGRRWFLQFDAASLRASVYVNGALVGEHQGGFAAFRFDVTDQIHAGADNVVAVKVDNSVGNMIPLEGDFTVFGGLYRKAHLIGTDALHLRMDDYGSDGVFLTPSHVEAASADLKILTELTNDDAVKRDVTVTATVLDADGHAAATLTKQVAAAPRSNADVVLETVLKTPHLWDGLADPYLYHVTVELREGGRVIDSVREPLGFRAYAISPDTGFSLNGRYLDLHGVNKHQDALDQGWAVPDAGQDTDFALIKELGANVIRLSHYQHSQHTLDLCDRAGLVTWAEIPLIDLEGTRGDFADNTRRQLTELIKQNYNHPAICFWSIANEIGGKPAVLLTSLNDTAHALDPSRLTVLAANRRDSDPINFVTDAIGYNRYFGWYYGWTEQLGPWMDQFHRNYPKTPVGLTEYGAGASIAFHGDDPEPIDHTEEYQALLHERTWRTLSERPYLWCKLVWNMFDFAVDGRREGDQPGRNDKGLVTYDRRTRKDAFYFYKANWSKEPTVYITGRRYDNRFGAARTIKVYSNADTVDLTVNGADLGGRAGENHIFQWPDAAMNAGPNTVVASAVFYGKTVTDTVVWHVPARLPDGAYTISDAATRLRLNASKSRRSGAQVQEYRADAENDQIWSFLATADGSYQIKNADSGLTLAAEQIQGDWTVTQQAASDTRPQTWLIEPTEMGIRIVHQQSGMILANVDYYTAEGMSVALVKPLEVGRAEWSLQPATVKAANPSIKSEKTGDPAIKSEKPKQGDTP